MSGPTQAGGWGLIAFFNVNPSMVNARAFEVPKTLSLMGGDLEDFCLARLGGAGTETQVICVEVYSRVAILAVSREIRARICPSEKEVTTQA